MITLNKKKMQRIVNKVISMYRLSCVGYYTCYINFYGWNDKIVVKLEVVTDNVLCTTKVTCYNFNTSQQYYQEIITHGIKADNTIDWDKIENYINKAIKEHREGNDECL